MNNSSTFSRRDFLGAASGAGFALAVQPIVAHSAIVTSPKELLEGFVTIPVGTEQIRAYRARPQGSGHFPVILVVQEIFGVHAYIQDVCRRLAKQGYQAIAMDLYQRQGDPTSVPKIATLIETIVSKVPDEQVMRDLDAAVVWAKADGHGNIERLGITGFCWGGRMVWLYAMHNPALKAGVAWYGKLLAQGDEKADPKNPRSLMAQAANLKAPVLGLYGGKDEGIPMSSVEAMRAALTSAGKTGEIHVYPDAPHAFHADYRPTYRPAEAVDGWQRMTRWFQLHGV